MSRACLKLPRCCDARPRGGVCRHGKYLHAAGRDGFTTHELLYSSVERVVEVVRSQKFWTLCREAELALYRNYRPDLVLLDNRPGTRTSANIADIPAAAVRNAHMSNYRRIPFFSYRQMTGDQPGTG